MPSHTPEIQRKRRAGRTFGPNVQSYKIYCHRCGVEKFVTRPDARFCGAACRNAVMRARRAEELRAAALKAEEERAAAAAAAKSKRKRPPKKKPKGKPKAKRTARR